MRNIRIDLRRCKHCGKIPRGKLQKENAKRYEPYCSYQCHEFGRMQSVLTHCRGAQR